MNHFHDMSKLFITITESNHTTTNDQIAVEMPKLSVGRQQ